MTRTCCYELLLFIMLVVCPPLGVLLDKGFNAQFVINVLLTLLFVIPSLIYGIWIPLSVIPGFAHGFWVCYYREKAETDICSDVFVV